MLYLLTSQYPGIDCDAAIIVKTGQQLYVQGSIVLLVHVLRSQGYETFFSCSAQLRLKIILLINVKMNCWHFNIYEQDKLLVVEY